MARGEHLSQFRATRWQVADTELYCRHVRACDLQADLGKNRCAVPADARPAGGEHARPLQRTPDQLSRDEAFLIAVSIAKLPSVPR
jgi:hypothetical protein